ncbi:MAG: hypothetical protein WB869_00235 [Candidatus Acidiferrales bacterium]
MTAPMASSISRKIALLQNSSNYPEKNQNLNSTIASIPPRMQLILKDGILPNPGKLLKHKWRCESLRLAPPYAALGTARHHEKRQNLDSSIASIPHRMCLILKDEIFPIPGKLQNTHFVPRSVLACRSTASGRANGSNE